MASEYVLPLNASDAQEFTRLQLQHRIFVDILDGLSRAPLDLSQVRTVCEIGSGTGDWARDFAAKYPEAEIDAFDVSDSPGWVGAPKSCHFQVADAEDEGFWEAMKAKGQVDYIFGRLIVISIKDWPRLLRQCYELLKPGGWIEIQDIQFPAEGLDDNFEASYNLQWSSNMVKGMRTVGLDPSAPSALPRLFEESGFESAVLEKHRMPVGSWPESEKERRIGANALVNAFLGFRGISKTLFTKVLGMTEPEHDQLCRNCLRETSDQKLRFYIPVKVSYARKPRSS